MDKLKTNKKINIERLLGLDLGAINSKLDAAVEKVERYQGQMRDLKALLRDPSATEFVAVAAPTALAVDGKCNDETREVTTPEFDKLVSL